MTKESSITHGSGNVFADLGFPNAEEHQTKAKLVSQIAALIEERGLTQTEAAKLFGIDQPKVSALLRGRFRGFSVYRIMSFIAALGRDVEIVTRKARRQAATEESGHIFVRQPIGTVKPL
jgi:predicted XRE-type DNA-binding protein